MKGGIGLSADANELANIGFNFRSATGLEPDVLVTVKGRPHAFMLFDELKIDAGNMPTVLDEQSRRLHSLQTNFHQVYLLIPGCYGHAAASAMAARHPAVPVITCNCAQDAVGTAARFVAALCENTGDGCIGSSDVPSQKHAVAVDAAAINASCMALDEMEATGAADVACQLATATVRTENEICHAYT
ncbi:hypothetical protein VOLCADRAFT_106222 [Volvox carteri f. nagariensis]|uniref:Uncharacterized protein n=1 Tax=Volvox carteri f. nagariensis TaxID=3068 RepID=D8U5X7_VOLCA|nr:uncharacterized protein VOLCADRAFT_106222 [Volvox carteri f. nagariensis]EFJ44836.1 hypothetical protein VOLCADRAFT_106222 [Volvox carteri f. nagariensis]|eukprot:XP_002954119.1 hypothetical protein VOLCADRAFT_106222 [Volvox carteri f. nagariensis]